MFCNFVYNETTDNTHTWNHMQLGKMYSEIHKLLYELNK